MIVVFHRTNTKDHEIEFRVKHFDPVAVIDLKDWAYELTFKLTNSINHAWWVNELDGRVQPIFLGAHQGASCRSTSVGDRVMLSDGRIMEVMPFGWEEVTEDDASIYWNRARWSFYINALPRLVQRHD